MENQQKNSAPENNSDNRNSNNNKKKPSKTVVIWIVSILLTFMIWQGITAIQQSKQEKITYDTFLQMLDDKLVTDVKLYNDRISFTPISKETGAEMDKTYYVIRISDYKSGGGKGIPLRDGRFLRSAGPILKDRCEAAEGCPACRASGNR